MIISFYCYTVDHGNKLLFHEKFKDDVNVRFVLDQYTWLDFYCGNSL
jgi:hypothetical protein